MEAKWVTDQGTDLTLMKALAGLDDELVRLLNILNPPGIPPSDAPSQNKKRLVDRPRPLSAVDSLANAIEWVESIAQGVREIRAMVEVLVEKIGV